MKRATLIGMVIVFFAVINAKLYSNFTTHPENNNPTIILADTTDASGSNIIPSEIIQNYGTWNIAELTSTAGGDFNTLVMIPVTDYVKNSQTNYLDHTGQIIINNPTTDTLFIKFPGTGIARIVNGDLVLNPAFHGSLLYRGSAVINFSVLYTTLKVNQ